MLLLVVLNTQELAEKQANMDLKNFVKNTLRVDDSLDVFAVHGAGGVLGILLVSFLIDSNIGGAGYSGSRRRRILCISPYGRVLNKYHYCCFWYSGMVPVYASNGSPYSRRNGEYDYIIRDFTSPGHILWFWCKREYVGRV